MKNIKSLFLYCRRHSIFRFHPQVYDFPPNLPIIRSLASSSLATSKEVVLPRSLTLTSALHPSLELNKKKIQKLLNLKSRLFSLAWHATVNGVTKSRTIQFSCSVVSNFSRPHGPQHARPPCPSPTPGVYSNSSLLSQWCHPTISSSVVPFSSCPQSFPESGSFKMSQGGRSGSGQATQVPKALSEARPSGTRLSPAPPPRCPRGRSVPPRGRQRRSPRGDRRGCPLNRLLQKWKRSQKRRRERINLQTKKCKQKGNEEQRENRRKWPTKRLKKTCLQKMERLKTRRAQPLMKQKRKKPSLISSHTLRPVSGPCFPSCTSQRNIFINYFVNASFLVALETFLKRRESHLIPFFKCKCFF